MGNLTAIVPPCASHDPGASYAPASASYDPANAARDPSEITMRRPSRSKVMRPCRPVTIAGANARAYGSSGATTVPWLS